MPKEDKPASLLLAEQVHYRAKHTSSALAVLSVRACGASWASPDDHIPVTEALMNDVIPDRSRPAIERSLGWMCSLAGRLCGARP